MIYVSFLLILDDQYTMSSCESIKIEAKQVNRKII